jgi:hypothetical protein
MAALRRPEQQELPALLHERASGHGNGQRLVDHAEARRPRCGGRV